VYEMDCKSSRVRDIRINTDIYIKTPKERNLRDLLPVEENIQM
jgi:hypothetical protein